jgi:mannosyltransferase
MALPKSMRYLAAATLCIFVYLFVQLLHTPQADVRLPGSSSRSRTPSLFKHGQADRDPQLDRKFSIGSGLKCIESGC